MIKEFFSSMPQVQWHKQLHQGRPLSVYSQLPQLERRHGEVVPLEESHSLVSLARRTRQQRWWLVQAHRSITQVQERSTHHHWKRRHGKYQEQLEVPHPTLQHLRHFQLTVQLIFQDWQYPVPCTP